MDESLCIPQSKPTVGPHELRGIKAVLGSSQLAMGPQVRAFEELFKNKMGVRYAIAVNSGTSALHLALLGVGAKAGKEVILPSYACSALLNAVNYTGARPVIVDVDPCTFCISAQAAKKKINPRTAAIVAVHTFGIAGPIHELNRFGVPVIEDCAHAIGGHDNGKKLGTIGEAAIFSFYATKMITTGEGGMLATRSKKIAKLAESLRSYDEAARYKTRYNYKMSDIAAALGAVQLKQLQDFIKRRREIARQYDSLFKRYAFINVPIRDRSSDVFYRYVILMKNKVIARHFVRVMQSIDIVCDSPISRPIHSYLNLSDNIFPVTTDIVNRIVSIPIYPLLKEAQIRRIRTASMAFLDKVRY